MSFSNIPVHYAKVTIDIIFIRDIILHIILCVPVLLVYCRVRIVPSEWRAKSVRRRTTVVDRRTPILAIGQTGVEAVRSRSDRRSRVPNHRIPAHVFRGRKLRRRQRQTHVSDKPRLRF